MRMVNDRYRLEEQVGSGGTAVVWRGYDLLLRRTVAVKTLPAADARAQDRLHTEAQAVARLNHMHIATIYDIGEDGTVPYLVMEFVRGGSLQQRLAAEHHLPWRTAARICAQVADALSAAHQLGVVHRDIKPANVMLGPVGVKVVDFGISAGIGRSAVDPDGVLMGTPAYVAPEQLAGGQVTAACDVYALGLLLYRCLTGVLPWPSTDPAETVRARRHEPAVALPATPGIPTALVDLCNQCLDPYPEARPTCDYLARALAALADPDSPAVRPAHPVTPDPAPMVPPADAPLALPADAPLTLARRARRTRTAWSLGTLATIAMVVAIAASPLPARLLSHPTGSPAATPLPADSDCWHGLGQAPVPAPGRLVGCEAPVTPPLSSGSASPGASSGPPATTAAARPARVPPPAATTPAPSPDPTPGRPSHSPKPSHSPTPTVDPSTGDPSGSTAPAVGPDPSASK